MQIVSAEFDAAVESEDQVVEHRITINLPDGTYSDFTLAVESCRIDRATTTDMPDGTRLLAGYPTASANLVLSGMVDEDDETKTAAWLFNPAASDSPLYRVDPLGSTVTIELGEYTTPGEPAEFVTLFTGHIDGVDVDPDAGTVTLSCLDNRNKLRSVPQLPQVASPYGVPFAEGGAGGVSNNRTVYPGLTSAWIIDTLLRHNGIDACPPPRDNCVFYASMNGSAYPQVFRLPGFPVDADAQYTDGEVVWAAGKWAGAVPARSSIYCSTKGDGVFLGVGGGGFAEWWMDTTNIGYSATYGGSFAQATLAQADPLGETAGALYQFGPFAQRTSNPNEFKVGVSDGTHLLTGTVTLTPGWHQFSFSFSFPTATQVTWKAWVDGAVVGSGTGTIAALPGANADAIQWSALILTAGESIPCEAVQVTSDPTQLPLPSTWTPTAVLDESLNMLTATVDIAGLDPGNVIQDLADAEAAVAGFDETGLFRFINRSSANSTPVRQITSASSLKQVTFSTSGAAVRNRVTAKVNVVTVSPYMAVWSASTNSTLYKVPAGVTGVIIASLDQPAIVSPWCGLLPSGGVSDALYAACGYRAAVNKDGSGGAVTNLLMQVTPLSPTAVKVEIGNPNGFPVYLVTPSGAGYPSGSVGQPALVIAGQQVTSTSTAADTGTTTAQATLVDSQWPPASEGGAASSSRGELALQLPDIVWRQDVASTQWLTDDLLADLYRPRPDTRGLVIVTDPRLQLRDRATLVDEDASELNDDVIIFAITTTFDGNTWEQTIDARMVGAPGSWIMGVAGRSEMGVATYV